MISELCFSLQICNCRDNNNMVPNNSGNLKPGPCSDELIAYLRLNSEYRLNVVVGALQS